VQSFDGLTNGTKQRWLVSSKGGGLPRWRSDGGELFYMTPDGRMMSVPIHPGSNGGVGPPRMLFQTRPVPKSWNLYDVTPAAPGKAASRWRFHRPARRRRTGRCARPVLRRESALGRGRPRSLPATACLREYAIHRLPSQRRKGTAGRAPVPANGLCGTRRQSRWRIAELLRLSEDRARVFRKAPAQTWTCARAPRHVTAAARRVLPSVILLDAPH
jgi:hypothetical protein